MRARGTGHAPGIAVLATMMRAAFANPAPRAPAAARIERLQAATAARIAKSYLRTGRRRPFG